MNRNEMYQHAAYVLAMPPRGTWLSGIYLVQLHCNKKRPAWEADLYNTICSIKIIGWLSASVFVRQNGNSIGQKGNQGNGADYLDEDSTETVKGYYA